MFALILFIVSLVYLYRKNYFSAIKKWTTYLIVYTYLRFVRKQRPLFSFDINSNDLGKLGISSLLKATQRENPRTLENNLHAFDGVCIWGANKDGNLIHLQLSRRHNRHSEISLYLKLSNGDEYQLPLNPDTNIYNTDDKTLSAAGLSFEVLEPLRRWRVNYNGYLRRESDQQLIEANINFLWIPASCYVSFPEDYNASYMAAYLTQQKLCPSQFCNRLSVIERHENSGQLHGIIKLEETSHHLLLRGFKTRSHGNQNWENVHFKVSIEAFLHDGGAINLFIEEIPNKKCPFVYGYVLPPCNMSVLHFTSCDIKGNDIVKIINNSQIEMSFKAGGWDYNVRIKKRNTFQKYYGDDWEAISTINCCDVILNGISGDGIMEVITRNYSHSPFGKRCSLPHLTEPEIKSSNKLVLPFSDVSCRSSALVGGKGASLALMTSIYGNLTQNFTVPPGVCITKTAFEIHSSHNPKIQSAISNLISIAWSGDAELIKSLPIQCENVVQLVSDTPVSTQLKEEIELALSEIFKDSINDIKFAVRSSAIGEDGEELSAAGQNETFLGIKSIEKVCSMISKCWASQFAFRSVEYKRQNGQLLDNGIGVVVQQMVPAQVAGVLFSCDPINGNPNKIYIAANYGLGESVVSASADPDTIIIKRTHDDQLDIQEITIGSKKISIQMSDDSGTVDYENDEKAVGECSLTKDNAIRLANIAVYLAKCFGNGRDIEWAIHDQNIYILQSRPVTTDASLTDFEVLHEFDSILRTDKEAFTTANVSEVLPGAQTALTTTSIFRGQIPYFQGRMMWRVDCYKYDPIVIDWMATFYGHVMFDLITQKAWNKTEKKDAVLKAFDIGIFGKSVDESDIMKTAVQRFKIRPPIHKQMVFLTLYVLRGMAMGGRLLKKATREFQNYRLAVEGTESMTEVYSIIQKSILDVNNIMDPHLSVTFASTIWNMIVLNLLSTNKNDDDFEFAADQYTDFATLIGSCNGAESGNVPESMGELATAISQSKHHQDFSQLPSNLALESIVNSKDAKVKALFSNFLQRHGHRGMKECDLICQTWSNQPEQLITILQEMTKSTVSKTRAAESLDDTIKNLKSNLSPFKKFLLKMTMKFSRQAVCYRESCKSLFVRYIHETRVAFRYLANLMVRQGLLVDPELIYFFTNEELLQFISTRSPKILRRAKCRWRLHDYKDKLIFPEIIRGTPKPINDTNEEVSAVDYSTIVTGFPISQGVVTAKARVVTTFHDVNTIMSGEILITHATDIGWSPYFPMISGIVTEIGGLVSHGAVVAREFGLPCIVGVNNATKLFKSGDLVLLNATHGTLMKLKPQEETSC